MTHTLMWVSSPSGHMAGLTVLAPLGIGGDHGTSLHCEVKPSRSLFPLATSNIPESVYSHQPSSLGNSGLHSSLLPS